jgi:hypothetical protein
VDNAAAEAAPPAAVEQPAGPLETSPPTGVPASSRDRLSVRVSVMDRATARRLSTPVLTAANHTHQAVAGRCVSGSPPRIPCMQSLHPILEFVDAASCSSISSKPCMDTGLAPTVFPACSQPAHTRVARLASTWGQLWSFPTSTRWFTACRVPQPPAQGPILAPSRCTHHCIVNTSATVAPHPPASSCHLLPARLCAAARHPHRSR